MKKRGFTVVMFAGKSKLRRIQMSGEFHVVPTIAPGVLAVPNPPRPVVHALSSNAGAIQSAGGADVVYRHSRFALRALGTSVRIHGGGVNSASAAARARDSSSLISARS